MSIVLEKLNTPFVPLLRFEEFKGKWEESSLEDLIQILSGFAFKSVFFTDIGQSLITPKNFTKDGRARFNIDNTKFTNEIVDNKYLCKSGDLLVLLTDLTPSCELLGKPVILSESDGEVLLNQRIIKITVDKIKLDKRFLANVFLTEGYHRRIKSTATGTTVRHSSNKIINTYKISLPTLPEQQKIASFLSAVDEKIQQLTKKKALLEEYKKGVMQQLFSGKLRFKDDNGEEYPEWEEKLFKDLYQFHSTNSLSRNKLNYKNGKVYNIHYGDIHTKFKSNFKINNEDIPYVNDDIDLSKVKIDSYCKEGDLVIADASEDYADIGKTIELITLNDKKVIAGLHTFLARPSTKKTVIGFFSYLLKSWYLRKQIMIISQGTKVLSLSSNRVGDLKLKLPQRQEQQKIAEFLSSLDTKIESVQKKIIQTQEFKKGLLQQMFV